MKLKLIEEPYMMPKIGVNLRWGQATPESDAGAERMRKVFRGVIVDLINCQIEKNLKTINVNT